MANHDAPPPEIEEGWEACYEPPPPPLDDSHYDESQDHEPIYDDGDYPPPPDDYEEQHHQGSQRQSASRHGSQSQGPRSTQSGKRRNQTSTALDVVGTLRSVIAAQHGKPFGEMGEMMRTIQASEAVLDCLDDRLRDAYTGVLECLSDLSVNCEGGSVDLRFIPTVSLYDADVQAEMSKIGDLAGTPAAEHPATTWFALREAVQREHGRRTAIRYVDSLDRGTPVEELVTVWKAIVAPTTKKASTRERAARTAAQVVSDRKVTMSGKQRMRLSSGYRTLDIAFTGTGEPMGFIEPGEGIVVAGPTGTGKSSWTYLVVPAFVQDLINWGFPDACGIFAHTEEESIDKIHAMDMDDGQSLHHLADNLVVTNVGTSRKLLAMTIYDCISAANQRSLETGRPLDQFLPYFLVLDYIQSLSEQGENEKDATAATAEFLLRGVQFWNPDEMAKFSHISYQEYTGNPWPKGMENHRCAVVSMAQLVKQDDKSLLYKPNARDCQLSDFALEDTSENPVWVGKDGNGYGWEVKEGDLRLFKQNAIRGSGIILQNATAIIILHRSRAYNNPKRPGTGPEGRWEDGRFHLEDNRSRFLLDKMRTGSSLKFVPMSFDLDWEGFRARYIDAAAEQAINMGRFVPHETYTRSGDPILPRRAALSPLAACHY